jgi:2-dehydro-3-deoxygalactonokinase
MTGEFFELLAKKSILQAAVEEYSGAQSPSCSLYFKKGVSEAANSNLLHAAFKVRTNDLFGITGKRENFDYLSGLLIGAELRNVSATAPFELYLCGSSALERLYRDALGVLGVKKPGMLPVSAEEAVVRGQLIIYDRLNNR